MTSRPSTAAPILAVLALLFGYAGGYFWLGAYHELQIVSFATANPPPSVIVRVYPYRWQASVFRPAGQLEWWWRDIRVNVVSDAETLQPWKLPSTLAGHCTARGAPVR